MTQAIEVLPPIGTDEALLDRVDGLLDSARESREGLHRTYLDIGMALLDVENAKAWKARAKSWGEYIEACAQKFGKARTSLFNYRSIAERLLPHMSAEQLIEVGVSKAGPLAQYVRQKQQKPPQSLIDKATDHNVGVEQFRAEVALETHQPVEKGKWYELAFFADDGETEEIKRWYAEALKQITVSDETPEWMKRKLAFQATIREALSSWEPMKDNLNECL